MPRPSRNVRALRPGARPLAAVAGLAVAIAVATGGCAGDTTPAGTGPTAPPATTTTESSVPPGATSGSTPGSTAVATSGPRACDLLTDADIQELGAVGVVKKEDNVLDTIYANHCRWTLEVGEINLGIVSPGGREFYDTRLGIVNGLEPVEGLPADIATRQDLTGTIFAVKGDTLIDLFTIAVGAPDEALVLRILENLERP